MLILNCAQGSEEWQRARAGIPTASCFNKVLTPKGAPSSASKKYACLLLAERLLGHPLDTYESDWMERGSDLEDEAVAYYELQRDIDTRPVGLCLTDDGRAGCSPDRLIDDVGGLEIKCPSPATHVGNLLGMAGKHKLQVQGALWITGRAWWDLLSFCPRLPPALLRVERDEEFITAIGKHMSAFCLGLDEMHERLLEIK